MKKWYEKYEMFVCISLIIIYVLSNSYCMQKFGLTDYRSAIWNLGFSLIIFIFIFTNKLSDYYGMTKIPKMRDYLYFIPLLLLIATSLTSGIVVSNSLLEIIYYILSMIGVGFLEEIIFRGFLFKMMEKDNIKSAIVVSSLTFGIGHIVNLFNGASLVPTLIQVCYAVSIGYLFVTIFRKGNSLWPCIITHILINSLAIFSVENVISLYVIPVIWIVISLWYSIYLEKVLK